ncbi:MAG: dihydropteroate synthase, partial [Schaalia hyovaginalis]|uniref:dihydropteroate synthase n=1 Tax=Schaalia hyovaginalis TaxID=29316 RepID=UPI002A90A06A
AIINDVSGGRWDPDMFDVVADSDCACIVQHFRALPGPDEDFDYGDDLMGALSERLSAQVEDALSRGIDEERIVIDPGLGFSLTDAQCAEILDNLGRLKDLGYPVLIGASRKRFVKAMGGDRDERTAEITAKCARAGIWAVRVHEIVGNTRAAREGNGDLG